MSKFTAGSPLYGAPIKPPRSWFERPDDRPDQRLDVEADGRVHGRWYTAGVPLLTPDGECQVVPRSPSGYDALFHRGLVETAEGETVSCGVIVAGHGNADDPSAVLAVVRVGDDVTGGWVAGALTPEATEGDAALLRRSHLSGEWQYLDERGVELRALAAVATGATFLMRTFAWGVSPALRRQELERLRTRDRDFRQALRAAIVENPPARACDVILRVLDKFDDDALQRRIDEVTAPDPARELPRERADALLPWRQKMTTARDL